MVSRSILIAGRLLFPSRERMCNVHTPVYVLKYIRIRDQRLIFAQK